MDLGAAAAALEFLQAARVVEMQVADEDQVHVLRGEAQARQVVRDALLLAHVGCAHLEHGGVVVALAQRGPVDLGVVAAHVVEDAAVGRLDQVGQDGRLDELAFAPVERGDGLVVAVGRREQGPETQGACHGLRPR
ncbi:hypothetical protein D9M68_871370 [compost metagenome]